MKYSDLEKRNRIIINRRLGNYKKSDRHRSMSSGIESMCDYTPSEFRLKLINSRCTYCWEEDWEKLGLDRLNNSLGHTKANTVVACTSCNQMRGHTHEDIGFKYMKIVGGAITLLRTLRLRPARRKKILKLMIKRLC